MYVNNPLLLSNNHLVTWASMEAENSGYKTAIYALNSVIETGAIYLILKNIDEQYFCASDMEQGNIEMTYKQIEGYLFKELGRKVKVCFKNKILEGSTQQLVKLLLYTCLHSKKKEEYIERIIQLHENIQSTLMEATQSISVELYSVEDLNIILSRVQQLENQVEALKKQLAIFTFKSECSQRLILQLEQQLKKKTKEVEAYKLEKQTAFDSLHLTNLDEYLSSFQRLQLQNSILNNYVEELEQNNTEYKTMEQQLRKDIENQESIIVDLNQNITLLKKKMSLIKLQTSVRFSCDDTCDVSRIFGKQFNMNQKQNYIFSNKKQQVRKSLLSVDNWFEEQPSFEMRKTQKEEALEQQMAELRKYNSDLIHKLDTLYKALHTQILQTNIVKQKNESLQRQNKFYRKQRNQLRKIHQQMENDILEGLI